MAYLVKYGDSILFEPGNDERPMHDARLSQTADGVARFEFTLPPSHPVLDSMELRDITNLVTVEFEGEELFSGYVSSMTTTLWLEVKCTCVSELSLLDGVMVRYSPTRRDAAHVLAELLGIWANLTTYSYEFPEGKIEFAVDPQSQAGSVGYEDPTTGNLVVDAATTTPKGILEIIKTSILEPYGAFLRLRKADGMRLVGIFPNAPDTSTQVVNLGENLLDYNYTETDEEMYNACLPVGGAIDERSPVRGLRSGLVVAEAASAGQRSVKVKTTSGSVETAWGDVIVFSGKYGHAIEGTGSGTNPDTIGTGGLWLTLTPPLSNDLAAGASCYIQDDPLYQVDGTCTLMRSIPNISDEWRIDYDIFYSYSSVRAHGMKCFTFQDNDIRDAWSLRNKAYAILRERVDFKRSLTVSALDMAFYVTGQKHLQSGQKLRVVSEPHGLDTVMYVRTADINLDDPSLTSYTLGTVEQTLSRQVRGVEDGVRTGSDNFIKELNNRISSSTIGGLWS